MDRDPPEDSLQRLRTTLAGPRGYRKIDALLGEEDAAGAIAALSPGEVFELVHQVGFEDAISYDQCVQWLRDWVPDATTRTTILAETPAKLFGFGNGVASTADPKTQSTD